MIIYVYIHLYIYIYIHIYTYIYIYTYIAALLSQSRIVASSRASALMMNVQPIQMIRMSNSTLIASEAHETLTDTEMLEVNPVTKDETFRRTGLGSVCEKDEEAVVERDLRVTLMNRGVSLRMPLGVLTTRRQYRVVSTSILDTGGGVRKPLIMRGPRRQARLASAASAEGLRRMSKEHSRKGPMPEGRAWCLHGHTGGGHTWT